MYLRESGDGGHSHSQYATDHEIDEVREEIAALRSEWEMKQRAQEAENNYWHYSTYVCMYTYVFVQ